MTEPKGPSQLCILAQRLAFVDKIPYHAIGDLVHECSFVHVDITDSVYSESMNECQHASGDAFCTTCDHNWVAVAPVGTVWLQCPSCKREAGLFKFKYALDPDVLVRHCNCGNALFYLTPDGHLCPNCGIYQRY